MPSQRSARARSPKSRWTTIRISSKSHRDLKQLAEATGRSLRDELEDVIEEKFRRQYLEGLNTDYALLKDDPKALAEFKKEVAAWDTTNLDGLEKLGAGACRG